MSNIKKMMLTALLAALGVVLPLAFHWVPNAGSVFLPMHIPVLLCGLLCGFPYGLACGIAAPALSHFLTGMPPSPMLAPMTCELAVYGLAAALLISFARCKRFYINLYAALIGAMLAGRTVRGILNALVFQSGAYSVKIWLTASFVTALPGIAIQLVLIPAIVLALRRAKLIDSAARTTV